MARGSVMKRLMIIAFILVLASPAYGARILLCSDRDKNPDDDVPGDRIAVEAPDTCDSAPASQDCIAYPGISVAEINALFAAAEKGKNEKAKEKEISDTDKSAVLTKEGKENKKNEIEQKYKRKNSYQFSLADELYENGKMKAGAKDTPFEQLGAVIKRKDLDIVE
jgi:hypothetical protein